MRASTLIVAAILAVLLAVVSAESAFDPTIMRMVNSNPKSTWKAGINKFASMTLDEVKAMLGGQVPTYTRYNQHQMDLIQQNAEPASNNPSEFDWRKVNPQCIHPIRDQAHCGSCWAFSASEAMSDLFCIASKGQVDVVLSPQDMVSCNKLNQGCNGGILPIAWYYLAHTGIVSDECFPYTSQNGTVEACPKKCVDGKTDFKSAKYKLKKWHKVSPTIEIWKREKAIEDYLMNYGPIQTGFTVYQDFLQYTSGVYQHVTGSALGGHAVKIVGYGVDATAGKYWIVANSWGTQWGMNGYFHIKKGSNECGFEGDAYSGEADLSSVPKSYKKF